MCFMARITGTIKANANCQPTSWREVGGLAAPSAAPACRRVANRDGYISTPSVLLVLLLLLLLQQPLPLRGPKAVKTAARILSALISAWLLLAMEERKGSQ